MTDAPDTTDERLAEYHRLFGTDLIGRERTDTGIQFRFRLRARDGLGGDPGPRRPREGVLWVLRLRNRRTRRRRDHLGRQGRRRPDARQILDEYYALPDSLSGSTIELFERFAQQGLEITIDDHGVMRPAAGKDLGIATP